MGPKLSEEKKVALIKAFNKKFKVLTDETKVAGKTWKNCKAEVMGDDDYLNLKWVRNLNSEKKELLERLREA